MKEPVNTLVTNEIYCLFNDMLKYPEVEDDIYTNVQNYSYKILQDEYSILEKLNYNYFNGELINTNIWDNVIKPNLEKSCSTLDEETLELIQDIITNTDLTEEYCNPLEYWLVSERMFNFLKEENECVSTIGGMFIWLRCCSGQSLDIDSVIQKIYNTYY